MEAELYLSATDQWQTLEAASIVRNYHSVALLMPDGRVWTAGSSKNAKQSFVPPGNRELTIELYSPPYMSASRPQILIAPTTARWNQRFVVQTPQPNTIQRVAAIRQGSMTHAFNYDQRYVGLEFQVTGAQELRVKAPPNARVAPPGWYLLFLIDNQGVPSVGSFIRIGKTQPERPESEVRCIRRRGIDVAGKARRRRNSLSYFEEEQRSQRRRDHAGLCDELRTRDTSIPRGTLHRAARRGALAGYAVMPPVWSPRRLSTRRARAARGAGSRLRARRILILNGTGTGSVIKTDPTPGVLADLDRAVEQAHEPACTICRPRPTPPKRRVVELSPWRNISKITGRSFAWIPMPVSRPREPALRPPAAARTRRAVVRELERVPTRF